MTNEREARGTFIVLDGVDGCGKSTQAEMLCASLAERAARAGREAPVHLREPGSTRAGERIREILLDPEAELGARAETLLFAAARRQMLDERVRPALDAGRDVVCERLHASTFAYQAVAGELGEEAVLSVLATWAGDPRPDVVLLLDLPVGEAFARVERRAAADGRATDRIEAKGRAFQEAVARGFRRFAELSSPNATPPFGPLGSRVALIDATGTSDEVAARVQAEVQRALR